MCVTKLTRAAAAAAGLLALSAVAAPAQEMDQANMGEMEVKKVVAGWPKASQEAVNFMTRKYGPPAAVAKEMIVWGKTGPWKRTIVFAREYPHEFPAHHTDVMQQYIDYKADPGLYDELAKYDGSVVLERTSGEMSARCDKEGANFLALNLAHEIATGKRKVEDARKFYGEQIMAMKAGRPAPYTERLMFQPSGRTGDPDMSVTSMGASNPGR
jgi:hypothetical protein